MKPTVMKLHKEKNPAAVEPEQTEGALTLASCACFSHTVERGVLGHGAGRRSARKVVAIDKPKASKS